MTRGSLQDGPGANAIWNITNVTRQDRPCLYTTTPWAKAMSENTDVIAAIKKDLPLHIMQMVLTRESRKQ